MNISTFKHWWLVLLKGLLISLLGLVALLFPIETTDFVVMLYALLIGVGGLFLLSFSYINPDRKIRFGFMISAIADILIASAMFLHPEITADILSVLFGVWLILNGLFQLFFASRTKRIDADWVMPSLNGLIGILMGVVLCYFPISGSFAFGYLLGITTVVFGVFLSITSIKWFFHERKVKRKLQ